MDDEDVEEEEEDDEEVPPAEARQARSWRRFLTAPLLRARAWLESFSLGGMGNYWQKHLWLTRSLRDAYAVLTRMSGNNYAKHPLKITNVPSREGIPMHRLPVTLCICPFLICWILKYMWVPANLEQRIFSVYKWSISIEMGKTIHTL